MPPLTPRRPRAAAIGTPTLRRREVVSIARDKVGQVLDCEGRSTTQQSPWVICRARRSIYDWLPSTASATREAFEVEAALSGEGLVSAAELREPSTLKVARKRFSLIAIKCENLAVPDYESHS